MAKSKSISVDSAQPFNNADACDWMNDLDVKSLLELAGSHAESIEREHSRSYAMIRAAQAFIIKNPEEQWIEDALFDSIAIASGGEDHAAAIFACVDRLKVLCLGKEITHG